MKKTNLFIALCLAGYMAKAQIKVYSGGNTVIGATLSSAPTSLIFQVIGNGSVFSGTSNAITSAAYIRGAASNNYSSATTPDYTWYGNDQVGLFHTLLQM